MHIPHDIAAYCPGIYGTYKNVHNSPVIIARKTHMYIIDTRMDEKYGLFIQWEAVPARRKNTPLLYVTTRSTSQTQ